MDSEKEKVSLDGNYDKDFLKKVFIIGLPIIIQNIIAASLGLVDNIMVGKLGELEIASVGVAIQIYFIHWMVLFGFSGGTATYMAQFWGAKDIPNIKRTLGFGLCVTMAISVFFFLLSFFFPKMVVSIFTDIPQVIEVASEYVKIGAITFLYIGITVPFTTALRTTQQTKLPLYISFVTFSLNTVLNYFLIFGVFGFPKMGVLGAATATVIARTFELLLTLFFVFGRKNVVAGKLGEYFSFDRTLVYKIVKNALPTTINESLWVVGRTMCIAAFARVGVTEYAAVRAGETIRTLFLMGALSLGDVTLIMVGEKLGENKTEKAYDMGKKLLKLTILLSVLSGLLMIIVANPIISLFNLTEQGKSYAFYIIVVYGIMLWLDMYNAVSVTGILRAGGDTVYSMLADSGTVWIIEVPMAFLGAIYLQLPIYMAVFLSKTEAIAKAILLVKRFYSKKWLRNLV